METIYDEEETDDSSDNSEDVVLVKLDRDFTLTHDNDLLFTNLLQSCCFCAASSCAIGSNSEIFGIHASQSGFSVGDTEYDRLPENNEGGELKVLRRSGTQVNGSHGDIRQPDFPSMTRKESPQQNGSRDYIFQRTVHDINRGRPKSAIIVTRSQSFNGMANQQAVMGGRRESPQGVVLGESFRHHRGSPAVQPPRAAPGSRGAVGFSFKKSPKVPKVPRPNRALLMFQSVKRGIREFIEATKEDINQLQHRETDLTSTAQQIKSAERYLKRLEFHLAKLDELHEFYLLQQQLREGVRTMHRAYVTSPGNQSHSLSNVKYGYKECTQTMCNIEAQLEAMMGTFNCKLKGMAGFARLCPGDVFEVTVRHGTQKWKTKGRIEKTGNQKWDVPEFNFKAVVGDIFNIKGLEVRAFKSVLLGQKSCETKDLFSANPQLMTVSINVNGSLKLSIVITWNPLDGVDESFAFLETPQKSQGTPRRRPVSVIALNGQYDEDAGGDRRHSNPLTIQQTKDDNFILRSNPPSPHVNHVTSYHGLDSPHVSARLSEHLPDAYRQAGPLYSQTNHHSQAGFHSSPALQAFGENDSDKQLPHPPTQNSAFSNTLPSVLGHLHFPSVSPHAVTSGKDEEEHSVLNIEDVLHTLTSSLEDYHGQYTELQKLEDLIKFAQKLIRKQFRSSSRSSSISVSIESALEAFDFLDTEEAFEEPKSPTDNVKPSFDDMLCSPESTAKTGDSGIESLAQRLSEDTQLGSSLGSSPVPPSTGNEEVDQCLMYHLTYCERLLENLGAFGPLKCREIYALDKLQKQCTIVESLLKLAKAGPHVDLHSVMSGICEDKSLREFWVKCTDQNTLYIHPDRLLNMLEQKYSSVIAERHMIDPVKVCQHVITRVLDIPDYEAERGRSWFVLTLHQFMLYFNEEGGLKYLEDVAQEMKLVEKLTSGNPDIVIKAILTLRDTLPSSPCLKVIGMLLVTMDREVEQCTLSYLNLIQKKKDDREKALITFVEGLEDRTPEIRSGACAALTILEATESIDQLVYLWQSDSSPMVQKCAKDALLKLGDEGRKAFEDAQLSKHGFQGLQVHK
ncbi:rho family-interacting cell polarization regulator 2-like isoform X2 [Mercenaria mercenaria]|uniref:rho family-interacting cell polarization regulator 2-like isoform X2 n=1 Tax=Mercenaria mercenaria TaxID=6596 RepID=UPI00234F1E7A|nr:rho family-interacting cell polarization regulator 2-like isoform X2 [Mercenaria mercenaria]